MHPAPFPANEAQRVVRLRSFGVLDTLPQGAFDDITSLASAICGTPIALISLVDDDRQWFKSRVGLEALQTPRELAFCAHAINDPSRVMEVEDATQDWRFKDNPLVTAAPDIRFYAGAPIVTDDGFALGTVCVIDRRARRLDDTQRQALKSLANLVVSLMEHEKQHMELHRHRAEAADRQTGLLAALTAAGLDLISFVDPQYTYRYVNARYLKYWNKDESEILGRNIAELMGPVLFEKTIKPHFDRALAGHEVTYEVSLDFPGMGPRYVEVTYLPAFDEAGLISGVVVRAHDIQTLKLHETQLRNTVSQLEHKTLEQQRFIHIISHDLREPINTITNFSGLIAEDPSVTLPAHAQRYLAFVQSGGSRIKTLLDDLLEFLHMDRHALTLSAVDMSGVADQVRQDLAANIDRTGATVKISTLPVVQGDASLLRVLLQNLVANALKFCPKDRKPVVVIEGRQNNEQWVLSVTDNGIGIPPEQTAKIFEMFTRLNNKKDFAGSGLGLSICRRIAELHHGQITVTSTIGEGSRFELTLPTGPSQP